MRRSTRLPDRVDLDPIDIEIVSVDAGAQRPAVLPDHHTSVRSPQRAILATVGGVLAVAVVAVAVVAAVDDGNRPSPPTAEEGSVATTPAVQLPVPDPEPAAVPSTPAAYAPPIWRASPAAVAEFELVSAVDRLALSTARRTVTTYRFDGHVIEASITHDPVGDRDDVVVRNGPSRIHFVVDRSSRTAYLDRSSSALVDETAWDAVGGDSLVRPPVGVDLDVWIDRLLLGPVELAAAARSTTTAGDQGFSLIDGTVPVRRFAVTLLPDLLDTMAWSTFPFDRSGAPGEGHTLQINAFVGQGPTVALLTGERVVGDTVRRFELRTTELTGAVRIELPSDALAFTLA